MKNKLYFGDNLEILRESIPDESVDLIYLDPPFNSKAQYNVLFKHDDKASAQVEAFKDTWKWGVDAQESYVEIIEAGGNVARIIAALHSALRESNMMAYLVMMTIRLDDLWRKLKWTGCLYIHCDPSAAHYLKVILDQIFGPENFRSEIVWRRSASHNKLSKQYGPIHDTLLFYSKCEKFTFNVNFSPYTKSYLQKNFKFDAQLGFYRTNEIMGPGTRKGESGQSWRGYNPSDVGRHWAIPKKLKEESNISEDVGLLDALDILHRAGHIQVSKSGRPTYIQKIGDGVPYQNIWAYQAGTQGVFEDPKKEIDDDVKWLDSEKERLGYPTQKPVGLLKRIIATSSNPGDIVFDPFCGCGTTAHAAQELGRNWIGIDVSFFAVNLIHSRISEAFGDENAPEVAGLPRDIEQAHGLAEKDPHQFQWWANSLVGVHTFREIRKGADRGIDGEMFFMNGPRPVGRILTSVKAGKNLGVQMIRDFRGTLEREHADMGIFICAHKPTSAMIKEALLAGYVNTSHGKYPKIQIFTMEDWSEGREPKIPSLLEVNENTFAKPNKKRKNKKPDPQQPEFFFEFNSEKDGVVRRLNPAVATTKKVV